VLSRGDLMLLEITDNTALWYHDHKHIVEAVCVRDYVMRGAVWGDLTAQQLHEGRLLDLGAAHTRRGWSMCTRAAAM
jgi:hypothetical protein